MQIADMVSKIIKTETVPIHMYDLKFFSSVTYLKPNSDKQRGLYLPNCDSLETLEYCKSNMPDGFLRIKEMICTKCAFDEISFCVFSILHDGGTGFSIKILLLKDIMIKNLSSAMNYNELGFFQKGRLSIKIVEIKKMLLI